MLYKQYTRIISLLLAAFFLMGALPVLTPAAQAFDVTDPVNKTGGWNGGGTGALYAGLSGKNETTVAGTASGATTPVLKVSNATGGLGDEVTLTATLENNPGIAAYTLTLLYDSDTLAPVPAKTKAGNIIPTNFSAVQAKPGEMILSAYTDQNRYSGEILFEITFKISDNAKDSVTEVLLGYYNERFDGFARVGDAGNYVGGIKYDVALQGKVTITGLSPPPVSPPSGSNPGGGASNPPPAETIPDGPPPMGSQLPYGDVVATDWFYDAVKFVTESGLMGGVSDNSFAPGTTMSRAMLVTVLYRLEGKPDVSGKLTFLDVKTGQWYSDAIQWANENGIVYGYSNEIFGLNDSVTREQAVSILYRYTKTRGLDVSAPADLSGYADSDDISSWALDAMEWAAAAGIVQGRTATTIAPQGTSTRAEVATVFMRYIEGFLGV